MQFAPILAQIWEAPEGGTKYLLLGEPTTFLDLKHQHQFLRLALELASEKAVVIAVIHDINLAAQYAGFILALESGKILISGTSHEVIRPEIIHALYNTNSKVLHPEGLQFPIVVEY